MFRGSRNLAPACGNTREGNGNEMGWTFRKSINLGCGVRINLSKSGVGYSFGVPGARITRSPDGTIRRTTSIPGTGVSHRETISGPTNSNRSAEQEMNCELVAPIGSPEQLTAVRPITHAFETALRTDWLGKGILSVTFIIFLFIGLRLIIFPYVLTSFLISFGIGAAFVAVARTLMKTCLTYEFDEAQGKKWIARLNNWTSLFGSEYVWHILGATENADPKQFGGSSVVYKRARCKGQRKMPFYVSVNVPTLYIRLGRGEELLLLPDVLVYIHGFKAGAVEYQHLEVDELIETYTDSEANPSDAIVLEYRWLHANKNGNPDKRYKDNRQIPTCQYGALRISAPSGMDLLLMCSNLRIAEEFAHRFEAA